MDPKTFVLVDDGKTYEVDHEDSFQILLKQLETPFLVHNRTHERVSNLASLVQFGTYKTRNYESTDKETTSSTNTFMKAVAKLAQDRWVEQKYDEAEEAVQILLSHQIDFFGTEESHPDIVLTHMNLAALKANQGDFEGGNLSYQKALSLGIKVLGETHPKIAEISTAAGNLLLYHLGRPKEASIMYNCTLAVVYANFGEESLQYADACVLSGVAMEQLGDYPMALFMHQLALSKAIKIHGRYHSRVIQIYNRMAPILDRQGEHEKAQEYFREAFCIQQIMKSQQGAASSSKCTTSCNSRDGPSPVFSSFLHE